MNTTYNHKTIATIIMLLVCIIIAGVFIYIEINNATPSQPNSATTTQVNVIPAGHVQLTAQQVQQKQAVITEVQTQTPTKLSPAQVAAKARLLKQLQAGK